MSRGAASCRGALAGVALAASLTACSSGPPRPAQLKSGGDSCAFCRMTISDPRLAGQVVQSGEEPRFFDDIGCLANYVTRSERALNGAIAYVADHRTGNWVRASHALYVQFPQLDTPMNSHIVAYADARSRAEESGLEDGASKTASDVFGAAGPPDGQP